MNQLQAAILLAEILANGCVLIAAGENDTPKVKSSYLLEQQFEERPSSDSSHRLGRVAGNALQTGTGAAAQDDDIGHFRHTPAASPGSGRGHRSLRPRRLQPGCLCSRN